MNQPRPVVQLDKDGKVIATFDSIREAARATGAKRSTIYDSCMGRSKSCRGSRWQYFDVLWQQYAKEQGEIQFVGVDTGEGRDTVHLEEVGYWPAEKPQLVHASLFSGIGGPEVAAAMLGWENAFHCEINPFGRRVLDYWFPDSVSYEDITKTDFTPWRGKVDILTGGFPCQPFSYAGKRKGREDERYLWPQMLRAIDEIRPTWVVGENVAGFTTMVEGGVCTDMGCEGTLFGEGEQLHEYTLRETFTIERVCKELESLGYSVQPMLIPAAAVGAPHRRDRCFIIAHDDTKDSLRDGCQLGQSQERRCQREQREQRDACAGDGQRIYKEPRVRSCALAADSARNGQCRYPWEDGQERCAGANTCRIEAKGADGIGLRSLFEPHGKQCAPADSNGQGGRRVDEHIQSQFADGAEPFRDGGERDAADSAVHGLQGAPLPRSQSQACSEVDEEGDNAQRGISAAPAGSGRASADAEGKQSERSGFEKSEHSQSEQEQYRGSRSEDYPGGATPHSVGEGLEGHDYAGSAEENGEHIRRDAPGYIVAADEGLLPENRWRSFPTVSPVHRGNDGLPFSLDDLTISRGKWREESIKAYGNAIVPQVMYRIFQAIESTY